MSKLTLKENAVAVIMAVVALLQFIGAWLTTGHADAGLLEAVITAVGAALARSQVYSRATVEKKFRPRA